MHRSHIELLDDAGNASVACEDALRVTGLEAWYGDSHILHGVDLRAARGEVVTLLGRNGSGRSTTLKAIMGLTDTRCGSVCIDGRETIDQEPQGVARLGVGYCPEERGIFAALSCEENLLLPPRLPNAKGILMPLDEIYAMFPNLVERRAS
jgi:branched-chain amino acid transport system ATP-binding protein